MLDGSLAIKNAQKQALARESVAAGSKPESGATRFSDFVDDARESEDERNARVAQAGEQAERMQASQMRARKGADAGKTLVTPQPAEASRAKVPADADKEAKPALEAKEPPPADQPEAPARSHEAKDSGTAEKAGTKDTKDTVEAREKADKNDSSSETEAKADLVPIPAPVETPKVEAPQPQPALVAPVAVAGTEQKAASATKADETVGALTRAVDAAPKTAVPGTLPEGATEELTPEQLADAAKVTRATQKETPKPALATATMASEETIPDVLQVMTPVAQPKPAPQLKAKAEAAASTHKTEAKQAEPDVTASAVQVKSDAVQQVAPAKAETDKAGKTMAVESPPVESPKETSPRTESVNAASASTPQVQVAAAPQQDVAPLPDPTLVPASDGSRLSLTPSTQQATPSAATLTSGPLVPLNQVAVSIATKAMGGSTRFDIRLDPPELGRIDVRLTMDREGRVKSTMVIEKRETYELMQRDQRNLETAMQQAGLKMNEGSVEFTLRDPSSNGQQNNGGNLFGDREGRSGSRPALDDPRAEQGTNETTTIQMYASLAQQRGGVDLRI